MIDTSPFDDTSILVRSIIAVLVKQLGGSFTLTQAHLDDIAYSLLEVDGYDDGSMDINVVERTQQ